MSGQVTPLDAARRAMRAQIQQVGPVGQFVVGCRCGWSRRANGRGQAKALKATHDGKHRAATTSRGGPVGGGDVA